MYTSQCSEESISSLIHFPDPPGPTFFCSGRDEGVRGSSAPGPHGGRRLLSAPEPLFVRLPGGLVRQAGDDGDQRAPIARSMSDHVWEVSYFRKIMKVRSIYT